MRSLTEKLLKVDLKAGRKKVLAEPAIALAHRPENLRGIFFYNVLKQELDYSETAKGYMDREAFKRVWEEPRGWIRGRVFTCGAKHYIMIHMGDWRQYSVRNDILADLYDQVQGKCPHVISDFVDEISHSLTENIITTKSGSRKR
jgi:hypothetical protein